MELIICILQEPHGYLLNLVGEHLLLVIRFAIVSSRLQFLSLAEGIREKLVLQLLIRNFVEKSIGCSS